MSVTHVGKIGRLSKFFRDELGRRIEDGEPGKELVKWLNGNSRVQEILQDQFDGRPITEENLSEWKQTGHPEWLRREETRLLAIRLTEQSDDLDEAADGGEISDRFASVLAAELARLAMTLLEKESDPEKRWQRLCGVHRELSQLRRDDHRAVRTEIKRERWNREAEREEDEEYQRVKMANKNRLIGLCFSAIHDQTMAEVFGGGEHGKKMAEMLHRIKFDMPFEDLLGMPTPEKPCPDPVKANPTKSELIQPIPTDFSNSHPSDPSEPAAPTARSQTQSNPVKPNPSCDA